MINKFYKKYLCLLELLSPILGVPNFLAEVVNNILDPQRAKSISTHSLIVNPHDRESS